MRRQRSYGRAGARLLAGLLVVGCGGLVSCQLFENFDRIELQGPECSERRASTCSCSNGTTGRRSCLADGALGPCECTPDSGVGDSGPDSSGNDADTDAGGADDWPTYDVNPAVLQLSHKVEDSKTGGIFAYRLDSDRLFDFVVTGPSVVGAYDHWGDKLWVVNEDLRIAEIQNSRTLHYAAAAAGNFDSDPGTEVAYVRKDSTIAIREGESGKLVRTLDSSELSNANYVATAEFSDGAQDQLAVQANASTVKAFRADGTMLWKTSNWKSSSATPLRPVDIDRDGLDEVVGADIIDDDGSELANWDLSSEGVDRGSIASIFVTQIEPDGPLEIAMAETGNDGKSAVVGPNKIHWTKRVTPVASAGRCSNSKSPSKITAGNFSSNQRGHEVFARSACGKHPWVFDSKGNVLNKWNIADTAPSDWFVNGMKKSGGIEEISPIDWKGGDENYLLAKERHINGMAAIIDAGDGTFVEVFDTKAMRAYAADVAGDFREEVVVLRTGDPGQIEIYWNDAVNSRERPRYWSKQRYRRRKQNWNYFSP